MVTVIRPSRARCVKGTIPRHERAVFTFEEAGCWLLPPQSPALTALLPPPTLSECRHRGLARRLVAVRARAVLMMSKGERPHPRRAYGRRMRVENTPDNNAFGEHVEVIIVPFARRPRRRSEAITYRSAARCRLDGAGGSCPKSAHCPDGGSP